MRFDDDEYMWIDLPDPEVNCHPKQSFLVPANPEFECSFAWDLDGYELTADRLAR